MALVKATLTNVSLAAQLPIAVLFNPDTYTIATNMLYPDISVPGLRTPLLQFIRGEAKTLAVELFLDTTDTGTSLKARLDAIRAFVTIDSHLHAPPVCQFEWGDTRFKGVMFEFSEKFTVFDDAGHILRARITIKLKEYSTAREQYIAINPQSPDRAKTRTVRKGDRLDLIAGDEYGDPALWPIIAAANNLARPRLLVPGQVLEVPAL